MVGYGEEGPVAAKGCPAAATLEAHPSAAAAACGSPAVLALGHVRPWFMPAWLWTTASHGSRQSARQAQRDARMASWRW